MKKYPVAKPFIGQKEKKIVNEVLDSGVLSIGPKIQEFERRFAAMVGVKYACAINSGTSGLHLAMLAAGIGKGDEVITSPFSFVASANCVLYVDAKPVFVDIDPITFNLDPKNIEKAITKKTKAILVVHIFGQMADMGPIVKIAKKHNLKIIEDACESICATYHGKMAGTFGESSVFAFYPNKQITTGEGGMLVTNKEQVYDLCCSLRNQGRAKDMQWLDHGMLGYNYRMDELSAALGVAQLDRLAFFIKKRQQMASWYEKEIEKFSDILSAPKVAAGNTHSWFVYVTRFNHPTLTRDLLIKKMQERGVATKPYLPSIHLFSFYRDRFGFKEGDYPISENVSNTSLALPFYIGLKKTDCKYIIETLASEIRNYANL